MVRLTRKIINATGALLAISLLGIYFFFDPGQHFFPKCPFFWLTGLKCPGCGAQRAVHHLLHGNLSDALHANILFVAAWPYVLFGLLLEYTAWGKAQIKLRRRWYGYHATLVALATVVLFGIARNLWGF